MSVPNETFLERIKRKSLAEPWVPVGCILTVGAFLAAYRNFRAGSKERGVVLLRYRVAFQGLTVVGMLLGSVMASGPKSDVAPAIKPVSSFETYADKE